MADNRIQSETMKEVDLETKAVNVRVSKVEMREKKSKLRLAIPHVSTSVAWIVLFFNVFLPGTGTLLLSLIALCGTKTDLPTQNRCIAFLINFGTALLQTTTAVIIVGWIWSVYWGMYSVTEASERHEKVKNALNEADESQKLNDGE